MPGKKLAGRNVARLKAMHGAVAEMMEEQGYACDGTPLAEASAIAPLTADDQADLRHLVEAVLMQGDSVDAKREALRTAVRAAARLKLRDPLAPADAYGPYIWIRDLFDAHLVYDLDGTLFQMAYTADMTATPPAIVLGEPVEVEIAYVPKVPAAVQEGAGDVPLVEAFVPLMERAVRKDGTVPIKVINAGWGTSGYYGKAVLERDGPTAFPAGTKMFWNHPTPTEAAERPERDLRDLAAVTTSPARWQEAGPDGPGLYADARVYSAYQQPVDEMAADIGVSIRANGRARVGEAEGRKGAIVEAIAPSPLNSIDFVAAPGRGGKVLQLMEAARGRNGGASPTSKENGKMPLSEEQIQALVESNRQLMEGFTAQQETIKGLTAQVQRAGEASLLLEARGVVDRQLANVQLHPMTRTRLAESLVTQAPVKDGQLDRAAFEKLINESAKAELEYLQQTTGIGQVRLPGGSNPLEDADKDPLKFAQDNQASLKESFLSLGLDEKTADIAAKGR